jgi:IS30 family transposase
MPSTPLSSHDRDEIHHTLITNPDASWADIGRQIERHPTTIIREVDANGGRPKCRPIAADKYATFCRRRPLARLSAVPSRLRTRIESELNCEYPGVRRLDTEDVLDSIVTMIPGQVRRGGRGVRGVPRSQR